MSADARVYTRADLLAFLRSQGFNQAANVAQSIINSEAHAVEMKQVVSERYWKCQNRLDKYEPRPAGRFNTGQPSPESSG